MGLVSWREESELGAWTQLTWRQSALAGLVECVWLFEISGIPERGRLSGGGFSKTRSLAASTVEAESKGTPSNV